MAIMKALDLLVYYVAVNAAFSQTPDVQYSGNVVATLDPSELFRPNVSLFWSPAGQAAWDELKAYHGVKAIELDPHTPVADVLNKFEWDAAKTLPDGTVIYGGDDSEAFRQEIRDSLRRLVGANAASMIGPYLPPAKLDAGTFRLKTALIVSCISHAPKFPASFRPSSTAFRFSDGKSKIVKGFGCIGNETAAHFDVVEVLYDDFKGSYILKLTFFSGDKGRPEFMLVGMRPELKNLTQGIQWMRDAMKNPLPKDQAVSFNKSWWRYHNQLTPSDHFWLPKLKTTLACDYGELIGKTYLRQLAKDGLPEFFWRIREAQQLLVFRLDEQGALSQAIFKVAADFLSMGPSVSGPKPADPTTLPFLPRKFIFNGPFIATLWMKGAEWPYLACWADSEAVLIKD